MREFDPSMLTANPATSSSVQQEAGYDISTDPFASYFTPSEASTSATPAPPKVLITTSHHATKSTYEFCDELVGVIPGAEFIRRNKRGNEKRTFEIGRIAGWASGRGYGALAVVNEDMKRPSEFFVR